MLIYSRLAHFALLLFPSCSCKMNLCHPAKSIWCHTHTLENKIGKKGRKKKSIFDYKMYISYLCCYNRNRIGLSSKARPWQGYMGFTDAVLLERHQFESSDMTTHSKRNKTSPVERQRTRSCSSTGSNCKVFSTSRYVYSHSSPMGRGTPMWQTENKTVSRLLLQQSLQRASENRIVVADVQSWKDWNVPVWVNRTDKNAQAKIICQSYMSLHLQGHLQMFRLTHLEFN